MAATMLMLLGALLIVLVNQTVAPLLFLTFFVVLGLMLCRGFGKHEQRAFGLIFATCVLVTGLSQIYAQMVFNQSQTHFDAIIFYKASTERLWGSLTLTDMKKSIDGSLSVFVWNRLYTLNRILGFDDAPWVGILFNDFLVGLSAGLTIQTARYLFGSDARRLKLLGSLFATCGMFWLFGALHLRDSFTLFAQTLLLYGFVRALALPQVSNGILLSIILFFVTLSSFYLREEGVALIAVFCVLGLMSWIRDRKYSGVRLFFLWIVGFIVASFIFIDTFVSYQEFGLRKIITIITSVQQHYKKAEALSSAGLRFSWVVDQPLLIRLLTGSVYMHIYPLPLWAYFKPVLTENYWIKGYQGLYLAAITPFGVVGIYTALKQTIRRGLNARPLCFLALYTIVTLFSVVVTSLETRHLGQFLPAFLILSVLPDRWSPRIRSQLKLCCVVWYSAVVGIHCLYIVVKNF